LKFQISSQFNSHYEHALIERYWHAKILLTNIAIVGLGVDHRLEILVLFTLLA